jgi:hypothetical protein
MRNRNKKSLKEVCTDHRRGVGGDYDRHYHRNRLWILGALRVWSRIASEEFF